MAAHLTPADFPHLQAYVDEIAHCKEAERQAATELAQAEYERGMHEIKITRLRQAYETAKKDSKQARAMFDDKISEMVSGETAGED